MILGVSYGLIKGFYCLMMGCYFWDALFGVADWVNNWVDDFWVGSVWPVVGLCSHGDVSKIEPWLWVWYFLCRLFLELVYAVLAMYRFLVNYIWGDFGYVPCVSHVLAGLDLVLFGKDGMVFWYGLRWCLDIVGWFRIVIGFGSYH